MIVIHLSTFDFPIRSDIDLARISHVPHYVSHSTTYVKCDDRLLAGTHNFILVKEQWKKIRA